MTLREVLKDAKKALGAAATVEAGAVALGLLDNATAGYVTAGIGAATGAVVYLLRNIPPAPKVTVNAAAVAKATTPPPATPPAAS